MKITDTELKIIYKDNKPYGIRDSTGYLFFFCNILKWPGHEKQYEEEISQQRELANYLLKSLIRGKKWTH